MPFLNLKKSGLNVERADHPKYQTELHVTVPAESSEVILSQLKKLTQIEGSELRTDLSEDWTLFWKLRSGESRFLLAHPEPEQWVGTLALSAEHLQEILTSFSQKGRVSFSKLSPIARMSNLEVSFTFL